jgi:Flp pilus assembly protein TadG
MRRVDDDGAVTIIVAVTLIMLLGFGALAIDVGALYQERRELQNGADAAALAVAEDCAGGSCGDYWGTAEDYAAANANDKFSAVSDIIPAGLTPQSGRVTVFTDTERPDGGNEIAFRLAQVLDSSFQGATVNASATVVWGAANVSYGDLPLAASMCEWNKFTGGDVSSLKHIDEIPSGPYFGKTQGQTIIFHNSNSPHDECSAQPGFDANSDGKLPAGFGWLEQVGCEVKVAAYDEDDPSQFWGYKDPGNNPHGGCLAAALGTVVTIPIFVDFKKATPRDQYLLWAPAGFYLTGYRFPGISVNPPCSAPNTCISGHFVRKVEPNAEPGDGPNLGVMAVKMTN